MLSNVTMQSAIPSDVELIGQSLAGDRQAFGQIVARYQSLICAIAYNGTGNLAQSEDIAQETFLAAWQQLDRLQEPARLRAWLGGIARNLTANRRRRDQREPARAAESLDHAAEFPAAGPEPAQAAMSREEETLLWRALEQIPDHYREPLILFYREQESVRVVAAALELSEDAVKQRLSRGRALLQQQVQAFVEGALKRSTPGRAFTLGVLAALPVMSGTASAATLGAAAVKGSSAAKAAAATGLSGALLGPLIGFLGAYLGVRASIQNAKSARERQFMTRLGWATMILVFCFTGSIFALVFGGRSWLRARPDWFAALFITVLIGYVVGLVMLIVWGNRRRDQIRAQELSSTHAPTTMPTPPTPPVPVQEYRSTASFLGLPLVHILFTAAPCGAGRRWARGWIALGNYASGVLFAGGGIAVGGVAFGGLALGLVSFGGVAAGALAIAGVAFGGVAFGGVAFGGLAIGGAAIGWIAYGGCAIAWKAAVGGLAIAHDVAQGGSALATHANDDTAREFIRSQPFFEQAPVWLKRIASPWATFLILGLAFLPVAILRWLAARKAASNPAPEDAPPKL